jgi:hypothetical protein
MASRDHLMKVATEISKYLNAFGLAFKTYNESELDEMIKVIAGPGTKITSPQTAEQFSTMLLERGFVIFPSIGGTTDGYVRVIRANSLTNNLLTAFRYPGANGDAELAKLLNILRSRRHGGDVEESGPGPAN